MFVRLADKRYRIPMKDSEMTWEMGQDINAVVEHHGCHGSPEAQQEILALLIKTDTGAYFKRANIRLNVVL